MSKRLDKLEQISVLVPRNPFKPKGKEANHCLCVFDVEKLMEWWPGQPHSPHRNASKVSSIQRSLDWKRVAHIASYLLQAEIDEAPKRIEKYFKHIYEPRKHDPGREWPPRVKEIVGFEPSEYRSFSNILVHINGARITEDNTPEGIATLNFDSKSKELNFTVIDGQHRINGAYLALMILRETSKNTTWEIPAEVFVDLDKPGEPPRMQAQIFIDVNFHQKKVDRSLVTDLFPTTRAGRDPISDRERAQDIGRRLMLESGPLKGLVQIPGIQYGVKGVVSLATLVGAIEDVLAQLQRASITSMNGQADFISIALSAWLSASGRRVDPGKQGEPAIDSQNVVYQGRILVAALSLLPAMLLRLKKSRVTLLSTEAENNLTEWLRDVITRAGFLKAGKFMDRKGFKREGYLGSGGIGRFRNRLWGSVFEETDISRWSDERIAKLAAANRELVAESMRKAFSEKKAPNGA